MKADDLEETAKSPADPEILFDYERRTLRIEFRCGEAKELRAVLC